MRADTAQEIPRIVVDTDVLISAAPSAGAPALARLVPGRPLRRVAVYTPGEALTEPDFCR